MRPGWKGAAAAAPARFAPKGFLLARLIELFGTGMATPRGLEAQRLAIELTPLGFVTAAQLSTWFNSRKSRMSKETRKGDEKATAAAI